MLHLPINSQALVIVVAVSPFLTMATSPSSHAADKSAKPTELVTTKLSEVDADFHVQGEYAGQVNLDGLGGKIGLQVIALGGGAFDAVGYWGGLPGDGWNRSAKLLFSGNSSTGTALLRRQVRPTPQQGSTLVAEVKLEYGEAKLLGPDGGRLGTLQRTHRRSPTLGAAAPQGAIVLFDGTSGANFEGAQVTPDGLLEQGVQSKEHFQSCKLHLEFMTPYMPHARGQGRGNSGCYLQGRYEVQILDSFGLTGKNFEAGGIYETSDAAINMCLPPLSWQTYDIEFTAAQFDGNGKKTRNARLTVYHNGVLVQNDVEVPKTTRAAIVRTEGASPGPVYLQDHSNPVRYRNVWIVPR